MRAAAIGLAVVLAAGTARAEEPGVVVPVSVAPVVPAARTPALLMLLGGVGLTVGGVADLATAPLCRLPQIRASAQPACIGTSIGVGVALLGAGIPLTVVGARRWSQSAPEVNIPQVTVTGSSAQLTWRW